MPWYVAWAPTPPNARLGVFIAPHNYSRWTEEEPFCQWVHRTVRCTPDVHCSLSSALAMSTDRWGLQQLTARSIVARLSGAHRIVRCYNPRAPVVGLFAQTTGVPPDSLVHNG
jgi:hypothetical protein